MAVELSGVFTALVTPFSADGKEVDYEALDKLIDSQIEGGVDGLVPIGTTAESPTLNADEKSKIIARCVEKAKGKCKVIAGTGSNNTAASVAATEKAKELGVDAVLIVNPYYNKPSQEGLYNHVKAIAAVGVPIVLYNIPGRSGILMQPTTVARLFNDCPEVIAIKEATGSLDIASEIRSLCDITILSGDDSLTLPLASIGGKGVVSVLSNYSPKMVKAIVDPALAGDFATAAKAHKETFALIKAMFIETNPVPVKTALAEAGLMEASFRLPMAPLTAESKAKLTETLAKYGLPRGVKRKEP